MAKVGTLQFVWRKSTESYQQTFAHTQTHTLASKQAFIMQKRTCMRRRNSLTLYRSVFCISWLLSSIRQELQSAKNFTKVIRSRGSLCVCVCIKERHRTFEANNSYSWNTSKASFFPYSFSASDNIYQSHSKRRLCTLTTWLETSHLGLLGGWSCTTNVFLSFFFVCLQAMCECVTMRVI